MNKLLTFLRGSMYLSMLYRNKQEDQKSSKARYHLLAICLGYTTRQMLFNF